MKYKTLDYLLGGRWAISLRGSLAVYPFVVLGAPLGNAVGVKNFPFAEWTYISFLASIPAFAILVLLNFTIYKNRSIKPLPWWGIVLVGGILGLVKGFSMSLIGYKFGILTESFASDVQHRIANHVLIGTCLLPLVAFVTAGYDRYSSQRNKLLRQALAQNSQTGWQANSAPTSQVLANSRISGKIERNLTETQVVLSRLMDSRIEIDGAWLANYLRSRAITSIRPLSHSLFDASGNAVGVRRFRSALKWAVVNFTVYPDAVLVAYAVTSIANHYDYDPFLAATSRFAIQLLLLFGLLHGLRVVNERFHINKLTYKLMIKIGVVTLFELLSSGAIKIVGLRADLVPSLIVDGIWVFFLILVTSAVITIFTQEEAMISTLRSVITDQELQFAEERSINAEAGRNLAHFLHSNLQTALLNSANVIDSAAQAGNTDAVRGEIEKLQNMLRLPDVDEMLITNLTLEATLQHAKRNWDGLMQVQSQFKGTDKEGTSSEAKKIGLVLDEALSNSFRHGKASKVKITLEASKDTLKLSVIDNGIGPTNGAEGMGSQTFDAIAGSSWELAADQEIGSRFTLALRRS